GDELDAKFLGGRKQGVGAVVEGEDVACVAAGDADTGFEFFAGDGLARVKGLVDFVGLELYLSCFDEAFVGVKLEFGVDFAVEKTLDLDEKFEVELVGQVAAR